MDPKHLLADTGRSFTVWKNGTVQMLDWRGGCATLVLTKEECSTIAGILKQFADGETDSWPKGKMSYVWKRDVESYTQAEEPNASVA